MDTNTILMLQPIELYKELLKKVVGNLEEGLRLLSELAATERYQCDYEFRIIVDTAGAVGITFQGKPMQVIALCTDLVERATALQMWKMVAANENLLGGAYQTVGILGRAMESYHNVIRIESENGLAEVSSLAYHNIALIYFDLNAFEKSYEYSQLARVAVESAGKEQHAYASKRMLYLSSSVRALCYMGRLKEAEEILEKLKEIDLEEVKPNKTPIHDFYVAQMIYAFYMGDLIQAKKKLKEIKELIPNDNTIMLLALLTEYVRLCGKFNVDFDFYKEELLLAEEVQGQEVLEQAPVYAELRKYYRHVGDMERYEQVNEKYIRVLEQKEKDVSTREVEALLALEQLIQKRQNMVEIATENTELKLIAEEAIHHKNALQEAYQRLERLSSLDGLTQISSRRDFETRVPELLQNAKQKKEVVSIFMFDIDNFKQYNDTYGHLEGDEVLKKVAQIIRGHLDRVDGLSARFGGEEFIGACRGLKPRESEELANRIRVAVEELNIENKKAPLKHLTISVGIVSGWGTDPDAKSEMIRQADNCLYQAKNTGKNKVVLKEWQAS